MLKERTYFAGGGFATVHIDDRENQGRLTEEPLTPEAEENVRSIFATILKMPVSCIDEQDPPEVPF